MLQVRPFDKSAFHPEGFVLIKLAGKNAFENNIVSYTGHS